MTTILVQEFAIKKTIDKGQFWDMFKNRAVVVTDLPPGRSRDLANRVNEAEGDVASFNAMLEQYIKAPEITRTRLYLETMGDVLPYMGPKMIIDDSMKQLLPILPLSIKPLEAK